MSNSEQQYLNALRKLVKGGGNVVFRGDRTGTGTWGYFGEQMRFNLQEGFPLLTTKKVAFKALVAELIWFLEGSTDNNRLNELGAKIWDDWAVDWEFIYTKLLDRVLNEKRYEMAQLMGILYDPEHIKVASLDVPHCPEGWTSRSIARDKITIVEYLSPKYYEVTVQRLVEADYITPSERDELKAQLGQLGPIYGKQWRSWPDVKIVPNHGAFDVDEPGYTDRGMIDESHEYNVIERTIDQIAELIENLKTKPYSRRHVISAWNPTVLPDETKSPEENVINGKMALPPCHCLFQFYVAPMSLLGRLKCLDRRFTDNRVVLSKDDHKTLTDALRDNTQFQSDMLEDMLEKYKIPDKTLSCQLYQR